MIEILIGPDLVVEFDIGEISEDETDFSQGFFLNMRLEDIREDAFDIFEEALNF